MHNIVALAGLPGSGKSTYAEAMFGLHYKTVSSDRIRVKHAGSLRDAHDADTPFDPWPYFYMEVTEALQHGMDVVADATFLTVKHRTWIRECADYTGSKLHLVLFKNIWEARARNAARGDENRVPTEVMDSMEILYNETLARIAQEKYDSVVTIESYR